MNIPPRPETDYFFPEPTPQRSTSTAYALWLFGGALGLHRYYLGYHAHGAMQLLLFSLTLGLFAVGGVLPMILTVATLGSLVFWLSSDAVWIMDMTRRT